MDFEARQKKDERFFLIVWWILSVGLLFGTRFWALNQLILKLVIPLLFLISIYKAGFAERFKNKGLALYTALFFWACFSILYSVNLPLTFNYLQGILGNVIIWFITATVILYAKDIYKFLIPILIVCILHAYYGMIMKTEVISEIVIGRAQGLTANPNQLGFLMWYGIVIASFLILISRKYWFKLMLIASIVFFFFILFQTGSRKSLAAAVVFLGFSGFLFMKKRNLGLMIFVVMIGLASFNYAYDYILDNTAVGARLSGEVLEGGTAIRVELINDGIDLFLQSPVVGIGLGNFSSYSTSGMVAHNDYIEVLASLGLVGFIIYMCIFLDFGRKCMYLYEKGALPNFLIIAVGFLMGYLVLSTGRPAFVDPGATLMLAMFHGFLSKANIEIKEFLKLDTYTPQQQGISANV